MKRFTEFVAQRGRALACVGRCASSSGRGDRRRRTNDRVLKIARVAWCATVLTVLTEQALVAQASGNGLTIANPSNATAPLDHAALAQSYRKEAEDAEAQAAAHERMLERYRRMPDVPEGRPGRRQRAFGPLGPGSPVTKDQMVKHCKELVDSYKRAASNAADLAKVHASMALSAEPKPR